MRKFRLRRLKKVNTEALLIASGQNVKRLLAFGGRGPKKLAQAAALRPAAATGYKIGHPREHRAERSWLPRRPFFNRLGRFWYYPPFPRKSPVLRLLICNKTRTKIKVPKLRKLNEF